MLQINAKENAVIEVVDGYFPLGQRNTIKINILDEAIKAQITPFYTGDCEKEKDSYSYGSFSLPTDIDYVNIKNAPADSLVNIVDGYGRNFSRCLHYLTVEDSNGYIELPPDKTNVVKDSKYVFSGYIKVTKGTTIVSSDYFNLQYTADTDKTENDWVFIREEFTATTNYDFSLKITNDTNTECYIDTVKLFLASDEIVSTDNTKAAIKILSPYVPDHSIINKEITWSFTDDSVSVYLYVDDITVVNFQDDILCKLCIYQTVPHIIEYLGDYTYNKEYEIVYDSEEFILNGYIIPVSDDTPNKDAVAIKNKNNVIFATTTTATDVATEYIQNNYSRNPTNYDSLFITLTDLNNIKVLYTFSDNEWLYTDLTKFVSVFNQNFTEEEKQQARNNIGATSTQDVQEKVEALKTDLVNGTVIPAQAVKATEDAEGNVINATYVTKVKHNEDFASFEGAITDGNIIAGKAKADAEGNVINTTYATKAEVEAITAVQIRNKDEVIPSTEAEVQTVATDYIRNNYGRDPQNWDGLILTITDKDNDKILYIYSEASSLWINSGINGVDLTDYVSVNEQQFTNEQKQQARKNIGAGTSDFSGDYNDLENLPKKLPLEPTNYNSIVQTNPAYPNTAGVNESVAFGALNNINGNYSIGQGWGNTVTSTASKAAAFGKDNIITSNTGIALGRDNNVNGYGAIALGSNSVADGNASAALGGYNTEAKEDYQVAIGTNNAPNETASVIIGAGNENKRQNVATFQKDGTITLGGKFVKSAFNNTHKAIGYWDYPRNNNRVQLNTDGQNTITGSTDISTFCWIVNPALAAGGVRAQMLIRQAPQKADGTDWPIVQIEYDKRYRFSFEAMTLATTTQNIRFWLTADNSTVCYTNTQQKNDAAIFETSAEGLEIRSGTWTPINVLIPGAQHSGNLRFGVSGIDNNAPQFLIRNIKIWEDPDDGVAVYHYKSYGNNPMGSPNGLVDKYLYKVGENISIDPQVWLTNYDTGDIFNTDNPNTATIFSHDSAESGTTSHGDGNNYYTGFGQQNVTIVCVDNIVTGKHDVLERGIYVDPVIFTVDYDEWVDSKLPIMPGDADNSLLVNDIKNNKTGTKAFKIVSLEGNTFTVDGSLVGTLQDYKSICIDGALNYDGLKASSIDFIHNKLTVETLPADFTLDTKNDNYLWVVGKPGLGTHELGAYSYVEGSNNRSSGAYSHTEGIDNTAVNKLAHVEGRDNIGGYGSHVEGIQNTAYGTFSHAEGIETEAQANYSHTEGKGTATKTDYKYDTNDEIKDQKYLTGWFSHAEGLNSATQGTASHAGGYKSWASGFASDAIGINTRAIGKASTSEGIGTQANGVASHAGGSDTKAIGNASTALGEETIAQGNGSFVNGYSSITRGEHSFANGKWASANGDSSVALGKSVSAQGIATAAIGSNLNASSTVEGQMVVGRYNIFTDDAMFIVGNGNSTTNSNAFVVDVNGNVKIVDGQLSIKDVSLSADQLTNLLGLEANIISGDIVVGKASKDAENNVINLTYSTKTELTTALTWIEF